MSLRTHSKDVDVGYICNIFGGGGHKSAAAFASNKNFFYEEIVISQVDISKYLKNY
jgi:nanoRNase/pAp phosphatase (c-di-AMP/oligoRNAs hydrolase)